MSKMLVILAGAYPDINVDNIIDGTGSHLFERHIDCIKADGITILTSHGHKEFWSKWMINTGRNLNPVPTTMFENANKKEELKGYIPVVLNALPARFLNHIDEFILVPNDIYLEDYSFLNKIKPDCVTLVAAKVPSYQAIDYTGINMSMRGDFKGFKKIDKAQAGKDVWVYTGIMRIDMKTLLKYGRAEGIKTMEGYLTILLNKGEKVKVIKQGGVFRDMSKQLSYDEGVLKHYISPIKVPQ